MVAVTPSAQQAHAADPGIEANGAIKINGVTLLGCPSGAAVKQEKMNPYYKDDYITIYHGDCQVILPGLVGVRSIVADPPYGINLSANYLETREASQKQDKRKHAWPSKKHDKIVGDNKPFDPSFLLNSGASIFMLWGANAYSDKLPKSYSWLVWEKKDGRGAENSFSDCELCWCYGVSFKSVRIYRHLWCGYQRDSEIGQGSLHPTQKPVSLMMWCIQKIDKPGLICDPYAGSGSTLVAAKQLGLQAIGIEIVEQYCEVVAKRVSETGVMLPGLRQLNNPLQPNGYHHKQQPLFADDESGVKP